MQRVEVLRAELILDVRAELGEGPVWDAARKRLLFVDIMRGHVHEFDPASGSDRVVAAAQPVGAVAPTERGDWIVAARDGFYRLDPVTAALTLVAPIEADDPTTRMNDGYVDARGRFWAGTMSTTSAGARGSLYRLDPDGEVTRVLSGVTISNGIDWSPDGQVMYYADTGIGRVDAFDFDESTGAIRGRRPFLAVTGADGSPDGLIVDAEGSVWIAFWNGSAVRRYRADGTLDVTVDLPVSRVTKCAFGGPELADLYITTASIGLDAAGRAAEPAAGGLFHVRPGVQGRPATRFAG